MEMFNIPLEALNEGVIQPSAGIVSPITGTVELMHIAIGEYVEPNKPMFLLFPSDSGSHSPWQTSTLDLKFLRPGWLSAETIS